MLSRILPTLPVTCAALLLGGCRGDPVVIPPVQDVGVFIASVYATTDTAMSAMGLASYTYVQGSQVPGVIIALFATGGRYTLDIEQEAFRAELGHYGVGVEPADFHGTFSVVRGSTRVTYEIDGGTVTITELTSRKLSGTFAIEGVAVDGSNPGHTALTTGSFTAYCEGDCPNLGGGGGGTEPP
jgi:hypothetical protein